MSPPRLRRARGIRAFADKDGGWTLLGAAGEVFALRNRASLALWAALDAGDDLEGLTDSLVRLFPRVDRRRLRLDAARFARALQARGFLEAAAPANPSLACPEAECYPPPFDSGRAVAQGEAHRGESCRSRREPISISAAFHSDT